MENKVHLKSVTGARFFAAMAVIAFHFSMNNSSNIPWLVSNIIRHGNVAVNFFFVLSGFILAYNYADGKIDVRSFWWSRFARVYPLYFLALIINVPFFIEQLKDWSYDSVFILIRRFVMESLLLQSWNPMDGAAINGPGWSISVEALFYLIFPIFVVYLSKYTKRKALIFVLFTWIIALGIQVPLLLVRWSLADSSISVSFADFMAYFPLLHLPEFLIGAASGMLFQRKFRFYLEHLTIIQKTLFDFSLLLFCGVLIIVNPFSSLMNQALIVPLLALVIISMACSGGLITQFLAAKPIVLLGEISYAIYILQIPTSNYLRWMIKVIGFSSYGAIFYTVLYIPAIISVSFLSYYLVEVPVRRKIVRFAHTRRDGVYPVQKSHSAG